jgi:triosephosphate isomerase
VDTLHGRKLSQNDAIGIIYAKTIRCWQLEDEQNHRRNRDLVTKVSAQLREINGVEKVICPPFMSLMAASALLEGTDIGLGAQNMHWRKGAFTGETRPRW